MEEEEAWRRRVNAYKGIADSCGNGKYNFIHHALKGNINLQRLDEVCNRVHQREKDVDMEIVGLIRVLFLLPIEYLVQPSGRYVVNKITSALDDFPFWPSSEYAHLAGADALCFWTENHILMLLGSAHLYRQWRRKMLTSNLGIYTPTNVVRGGIFREDHDVMHVSSLGSTIHAVREYDAKSRDSSMDGQVKLLEEDKFRETRNILKKGTSSPQKEKVIAAVDSLAAYYKTCERYWSNVNNCNTDVELQGMQAMDRGHEKGSPHLLTADAESIEETANDLTGAALEEALLHSYINSHVQSGSMFEINSHVYVPYTASALLNVIDFSEDAELVRLATLMMGIALKPLILCSTDKDVCSLSASTRAFPRTRCRVHGHNVNQILNFVLGRSPDKMSPSPITDFLATTTWRPSADLVDFHEFNGRVQYQASPSLLALRTAFPGIPGLEVVPFFWSAGLLVHPEFVQLTKQYISLKNMHNNETLWPFKLISCSLVSPVSSWFDRLSRGQLYSDVLFNVYKRSGGLCMSSFEGFNVGKAGFQQLPWCVNLDGVGVWSESGPIGSSLAGFLVTNTYNPNVVQRGGLLVCSYAAPKAFNSMFGVSSKAWTHVVWPSQLFDKQRTYEEGSPKSSRNPEAPKRDWVSSPGAIRNMKQSSWRIASRNQCYIGLGCFQTSQVRPLHDDKGIPPPSATPKNSEGVQIFYDGDNFTVASRIVCKDMCNTFVVVVATHDEYGSDFDAFAARCLGISLSREVDPHGKHLVVRITDSEEGSFSIQSVLE